MADMRYLKVNPTAEGVRNVRPMSVYECLRLGIPVNGQRGISRKDAGVHSDGPAHLRESKQKGSGKSEVKQ